MDINAYIIADGTLGGGGGSVWIDAGVIKIKDNSSFIAARGSNITAHSGIINYRYLFNL